ncbi:hypothetical protein SAMN05216388_100616 [Halorientalis persicus]|jgi:hypothetical protein|uniref:Uncharacterized protein n=2 Tax=Halorientalis persicus TaxID=1367881 RepID=A0A1H8KC63_9EURY|nr:hypothetical protein SAMN05216388_100616 [Halorientalis persicus]
MLASNAGFGATLTVAMLAVLYSLLIVQQPLLGALVASWIIGLYVVWRFVKWFAFAYRRRTAAVESMADSLETLAEQDEAGPVFEGDDRDR